MLEKDIENLIAKYPVEIFPGEGFKLLGQQVAICGRRIDILFEDKHKRKIIVEVKRGILSREASGQIAEYYGLMKSENPESICELVLCANVIPNERRTFLETIGIECKELGIARISELARKYDYVFLDDRPSPLQPKPSGGPIGSGDDIDQEDKKDISVWIFQGNPSQYDILNALDDQQIGNTISWLVKQNKSKIHKGHLVLLWMSGKEAGIYALARVECEPEMMQDTEAELKYWLYDYENKSENRVKLSILKKWSITQYKKKNFNRFLGCPNYQFFANSEEQTSLFVIRSGNLFVSFFKKSL